MWLERLVSADDGCRLHYVVNRGVGPALVFLHGAGGNTTVWTPFLACFARRSWVAVDLRGHGRGSLRSEWSLSAAVDDVALILRKEGLKDAVVIGNCLGATIAVELRRRYPELVSRLVLFSVFSRRYVRGGSVLQLVSWLWWRLVSLFPHRRKLRFLDRQGHRDTPVWWMPVHDLRSTSHRTYFRSLVDLFRYPLDIGALDVPTLVVMGEDDPFCRARVVVRDAQRNPSVSVHVVPANHLVPFLYPDLALRHVERFVERA